jgi:hypothetical protein
VLLSDLLMRRLQSQAGSRQSHPLWPYLPRLRQLLIA